MEVIPAIDLLDQKCVRLYQGDYDQSQVFHEDPVAMAQDWESQGATRLHLVDLDGAKTGEPVNLPIIEKIVKTLSIPVQVGGGIRDRSKVQQLLDLGVDRCILGTVAVENPALVQELTTIYPDRIVVGIDARDGKVATRGWLETSEVLAEELVTMDNLSGVAAIIYTDISRDGTLAGPNLEALRNLAGKAHQPIIASGGVSSLTDLLSLLALEPMGVTGVIVGKALYTGAVNLKEAIQAIGNGRWQDVNINNSTIA
jgi:phosphoribosylformimino-5-aminoimidazole carboxamide ribotide isomerase